MSINLLSQFYTTKINLEEQETITTINSEIDANIIVNSFFSTKKTIFCVLPNLNLAQRFYDLLTTITDPDNVLFYPSDTFLQTLSQASSLAFNSERMICLKLLSSVKSYIVVTTIEGALQKLLPKNDFLKALVTIKINQIYKRRELQDAITSLGYQPNFQVQKPGEYVFRGEVLDIFLYEHQEPIRIVFDDNKVEKINYFNLNTQLSTSSYETDTIILSPLYPIFGDSEFIKLGTQNINEFFGKFSLSLYEQQKLTKDLEKLENKEARNNLDYLITFFSASTQTLLDYADNKVITLINYDLFDSYLENQKDEEKFVADALNGDTFLRLDFKKELSSLTCQTNHIKFLTKQTSLPFPPFKSNIQQLKTSINYYLSENYTVILNYQNDSEKNILVSLFPESIVDNKNINKQLINITSQEINNSFIDTSTKLLVLTSSYIFANNKKQSINYRAILHDSTTITSLYDIKENDYCIHYDHGIAKYIGLTTLNNSGFKRDYLKLEFANKMYLYVPLEQINLVLKYSVSSDQNIKLSSLGSPSWNKTKSRTKQKIKEMYDLLLTIYQERSKVSGTSFLPHPLEEEISKSFPYTLTIDQKNAISDCLLDLEKPIPMERLICGDVGFGKTEVAIRAAFRVVLNNYQVMLLAPTTILARQHYNSFLTRLSNLGVNIGIVSRLQTVTQNKKTLTMFKNGTIDILIGTHRLLSGDVVSRKLGLYIIDEEQRFGVKDKEIIKKNHIGVDTLYLSATPIPRTFQMALSKIKDLSLIKTPPINRYPVQTYLINNNELLIADAIKRELARGGQVYYLVKEKNDIDRIITKQQKHFPQARINYIYGGMNKDDIETTVVDFLNHETDILVATTIIENGIDVANANTIIINDAHCFGLAQLYQIKGRVGRSDKIAYCYLVTPPQDKLSDVAKKRLTAIQEFTNLGSGYKIAMEDLLIRGSGDYLGKEQSGFISEVGLEMYLKLVGEVVNNETVSHNLYKSEQIKTNHHIDSNYIDDARLKIAIHKKINSLNSVSDLDLLMSELTDRFGKISAELKEFLYERLFLKQTQYLGISSVNYFSNLIEIVVLLDKENTFNMKSFYKSCLDLNYDISYEAKINKLIITVHTNNDHRHYYLILNLIFDKYFKQEK